MQAQSRSLTSWLYQQAQEKKKNGFSFIKTQLTEHDLSPQNVISPEVKSHWLTTSFLNSAHAI